MTVNWKFLREITCKIKKSKKGLINIKHFDQNCFLWCHLKHSNPVKINPERITKKDKELVNMLNYEGIEFPVSKNGFSKIEMKKINCINVFFPFKIYSYFECILNSVESYEGFAQKSIKTTFLVVLLTNLFVLMPNLATQLYFAEVKMLFIDLLKQLFKSMNTVKK